MVAAFAEELNHPFIIQSEELIRLRAGIGRKDQRPHRLLEREIIVAGAVRVRSLDGKINSGDGNLAHALPLIVFVTGIIVLE